MVQAEVCHDNKGFRGEIGRPRFEFPKIIKVDYDSEDYKSIDGDWDDEVIQQMQKIESKTKKNKKPKDNVVEKMQTIEDLKETIEVESLPPKTMNQVLKKKPNKYIKKSKRNKNELNKVYYSEPNLHFNYGNVQ